MIEVVSIVCLFISAMYMFIRETKYALSVTTIMYMFYSHKKKKPFAVVLPQHTRNCRRHVVDFDCAGHNDCEYHPSDFTVAIYVIRMAQYV